MEHKIDTKHNVLIIAEVGSVHDGSLGNAMKLAEVAANCGANVVKFQTHIAEAETLPNAPMPKYFKGEPRFDYFKRTAFTPSQWKTLKQHCDDAQIEFLSSPFSLEAVELLEDIGIARYKIPSGEVTNLPLIEAVAQTGKPILLSSGMSTWEELDHAVESVLSYHNQIHVMQCTSAYPCPYEEVGLNIMLEMKDRYQLPVGLSDHTLTTYAPLAAVSVGASLIEKHLTFSRKMYGSDAQHSLEPSEFQVMVEGIRAIETMLTTPLDKDAMTNQLSDMKDIFEKSIVSVADIPKGTILTKELIGFKKPGTGLPANQYKKVLGRKVKVDLKPDQLIQEQDLE